ncbi:hypothetical protein [Vibrio palustris]|uniref:Uncharacterized protein n=1 Tax=Vibrio palustris TaxID=1918946 RepID=A0A1R4B4X3_9VIBR|nr:hypothetical protein [Vibrio palustris]SJL83964.1 hypothetical protein VPAL9027_01943 [Vibrio palustris]
MNIHDRIDSLEQDIYVACSEGDFNTAAQLEQKLERLRGHVAHPFEDDPYALEGRMFLDNDEY